MNAYEVGIILEEVRKVVREENKSMEKRLDKFEVEIRADIYGLKVDVIELKSDVKELKKDVIILKEDVSGLKKDVSILKEDVGILKEGFVRMDRKIDTIMEQTAKNTETITDHDKRISALEQKAV